MPDAKSVDEYIASQPDAVQPALRLLRTTIRKAAPEAIETISYKMPTYTLDGSRLIYFAAWKQYFSIYGATAPLLAAFQQELAPYRIQKGTIQFPLSQPVPVQLIARIVKFRSGEITKAAKRKSTAPKRRV